MNIYIYDVAYTTDLRRDTNKYGHISSALSVVRVCVMRDVTCDVMSDVIFTWRVMWRRKWYAIRHSKWLLTKHAIWRETWRAIETCIFRCLNLCYSSARERQSVRKSVYVLTYAHMYVQMQVPTVLVYIHRCLRIGSNCSCMQGLLGMWRSMARPGVKVVLTDMKEERNYSVDWSIQFIQSNQPVNQSIDPSSKQASNNKSLKLIGRWIHH